MFLEQAPRANAVGLRNSHEVGIKHSIAGVTPIKRSLFVVLITVAMPALAASAALAPAPVAMLSPPQYAKLILLEAKLTPAARAKLDPLIAQVRAELRGAMAGDPAATASSGIQRSFPLASAGQADQLTFVVMAEAANQARASLGAGRDSTVEVGEMESLRMQLAMDRYSKFMRAISNVEKKLSDTDASIIGNLK